MLKLDGRKATQSGHLSEATNVKLIGDYIKKLTLVSVAVYVFILAICVKGVFYYEIQHPPKEGLLAIHGIVKVIRLGGQGNATMLQIESEDGTNRFSSYYGIVWPGMKRIQLGDQVGLLAEKDKLNKYGLIDGKRYYIWELKHKQKIIISYEDMRELVLVKEATINRYLNLWLASSSVFLLIACIRKRFLRWR